MHGGRSGVQKHLGRTSPLCPSPDAGGQRKAGQLENVAVETGCAVHGRHSSLNKSI